MVCVVDISMEEKVCALYVNLDIFVKNPVMNYVTHINVTLLVTDTVEVVINVALLDHINFLNVT